VINDEKSEIFFQIFSKKNSKKIYKILIFQKKKNRIIFITFFFEIFFQNFFFDELEGIQGVVF